MPAPELRGQHLVDAVVDAVADYYGLPVNKVIGEVRTRPVAKARHVAMYLVRQESDWSWVMIGEAFGHRHDTAIYGCKRVANSAELLRVSSEIWTRISNGNGTQREGVK